MNGGPRRRIAWGAILLSLAAHLLAVRFAPRWVEPRSALPAAEPVELVVLDEPLASEPARGSRAGMRSETSTREARETPEARQARPSTPDARPGAHARPPASAVARDAVHPLVAEEGDDHDAAQLVVAEEPPERPAVCDVLLEPELHPGCVPAPERPSIDTWRVIAPGEAARAELARAARVGAGAGATDGPPDAGVRIGRALSEDLARVANRTPHLSERPPPRLHRSTDGSYRYEGTPFDAVIAPDGTVTFEDHRLDMVAPGVFTFDVTDEAMRAAGQDPYQHERQWFMSETRELRDRLADEARERDRRRAMRRLETRLATIWRDASRPATARRRAIFELWDDCAADDLGDQARRIVIRFIRQHLPEGSAGAYTAAELAALNADRLSPEPFAPYG